VAEGRLAVGHVGDRAAVGLQPDARENAAAAAAVPRDRKASMAASGNRR
jgi:hypothetical protein